MAGTYTLKSQVKARDKPTGSEKLAAYRAKSAISAAKPTLTVKPTTPEEQAASRLITSTQERMSGIDRTKQALADIRQPQPSSIVSPIYTSPIPSPVKDVGAWQAAQQQKEQPITPTTVIRGFQPESETVVAKTKEYIEEQREKAETIIGEGGLEKKKLSDYPLIGEYVPEQYGDIVPTVGIYRGSKQIATEIRKGKGSTFEKIITPIPSAIGGSISESAARLIETGGMVPSGLETLAREPSIIIPSVVVGTSMVVSGIGTSIKEEPGQFLTDIATQALLGYGVGKGVGSTTEFVKAKTPKIALKSTPQEFLIKTKLAEAPKIEVAEPTPITQVEFMGEVGKQPVFKASEVQTQISVLPEQPPTANILVGKTKAGYTDVYLKASKEQAAQLAKQYTGTFENIATPEGKFAVFEPTGRIEPIVFDKTPFGRVGTPRFEQIGIFESGKAPSIKSPFRIEKRVGLQKATLESGEGLLQLPEFTQTIDTSGKTIIDVSDMWKQPEFESVKQLKSGTYEYTLPETRSFLESERATLFPKGKKVTYKEPTFIGEMPEMQTRFVRPKRDIVAFKEAKAKSIDNKYMQKLYDDAVKRSRQPISKPTARITRQPQPQQGTLPSGFSFIKPSAKAQAIGKNIFETQGSTIVAPSQLPSIAPSSKYIPKTDTYSIFETDTKVPKPARQKIGTTTKTPFIKPFIEVKPIKEKKRKPSKIGTKKQQQFFELVNPLKTVRDVYGF